MGWRSKPLLGIGLSLSLDVQPAHNQGTNKPAIRSSLPREPVSDLSNANNIALEYVL